MGIFKTPEESKNILLTYYLNQRYPYAHRIVNAYRKLRKLGFWHYASWEIPQLEEELRKFKDRISQRIMKKSEEAQYISVNLALEAAKNKGILEQIDKELKILLSTIKSKNYKVSEENKWEIEHHQELVPSELKYFTLYVAA